MLRELGIDALLPKPGSDGTPLSFPLSARFFSGKSASLCASALLRVGARFWASLSNSLLSKAKPDKG